MGYLVTTILFILVLVVSAAVFFAVMGKNDDYNPTKVPAGLKDLWNAVVTDEETCHAKIRKILLEKCMHEICDKQDEGHHATCTSMCYIHNVNDNLDEQCDDESDLALLWKAVVEEEDSCHARVRQKLLQYCMNEICENKSAEDYSDCSAKCYIDNANEHLEKNCPLDAFMSAVLSQDEDSCHANVRQGVLEECMYQTCNENDEDHATCSSKCYMDTVNQQLEDK